MAQRSKRLGTCPLCRKYRPLTEQHIRFVAGLEGYRFLICRPCHDIVTNYEDEVQKAFRHLGRAMPGQTTTPRRRRRRR